MVVKQLTIGLFFCLLIQPLLGAYQVPLSLGDVAGKNQYEYDVSHFLATDAIARSKDVYIVNTCRELAGEACATAFFNSVGYEALSRSIEQTKVNGNQGIDEIFVKTTTAHPSWPQYIVLEAKANSSGTFVLNDTHDGQQLTVGWVKDRLKQLLAAATLEGDETQIKKIDAVSKAVTSNLKVGNDNATESRWLKIWRIGVALNTTTANLRFYAVVEKKGTAEIIEKTLKAMVEHIPSPKSGASTYKKITRAQMAQKEDREDQKIEDLRSQLRIAQARKRDFSRFRRGA